MKTEQSIALIETMLAESRKSLFRNSFFFILWGVLLIPASLIEVLVGNLGSTWIVWPIMGTIGGLISTYYGIKESKRAKSKTAGDRITSFTWGAFVIAMIISVVYSLYHQLSPHPLVLLLAGMATFISGGISKFKPFVYGGIILAIGAIVCGFILPTNVHGYIFALCMFLGYVVPGFMLRKQEHAEA